MEMRMGNNEVKLNDSSSSWNDDTQAHLFSVYRDWQLQMPKDKINDEPVAPGVKAEMIRQYLSVEGNADTESATFCQTYGTRGNKAYGREFLRKNVIDKDEYPMFVT